MPNIGALWAEMRVGGVAVCLWRKSKSTRVLFAGGGLPCLLGKFPFFIKYPLKEDKVFSESTPMHLYVQISDFGISQGGLGGSKVQKFS